MLFKRKNSKYWWCKFTDVEGNTIRESAKTTDKRKAQELADKRKALSWDETKLGHRPEYLWDDAVLKWKNESQKRTLEDDLLMFRYLDKFFSSMKLVDINREVVEKLLLISCNMHHQVELTVLPHSYALFFERQNESGSGLIKHQQYVDLKKIVCVYVG